jgi:amino acid adenylation domain-containing protein
VESVANTAAVVSPAAFGLSCFVMAGAQIDRFEQGGSLPLSADGEAADQGPYPLSFGQESLWFFEQMVPGTATYHLPEAWKLQGELNLSFLQRSLDEIVSRHEVLRTVFQACDGKPHQSITQGARIKLKTVDLPPGSESGAGLRQILQQEACLPFQLDCAPLARVALFRITPKEQILLLNVHHIISDAWSQSIFMKELMAWYTALLDGQPCALPELPVQYADFALWQREMVESDAGRHHLAYWTERFRTPPHPTSLPWDQPGRARTSYCGRTEYFRFPAGLVDALKGLSRRHGVTLYITLLAAFKTLLHRYTQEVEIVVGSPMACRERVELEGLLGFFVQTQALSTDLGGDPTFPDLVQRVRKTVLDAYSHQEVPCELLIKNLQVERCGRHPLFQVVFGWQPASPQRWSVPGLEGTMMELDTGTAKFDWTVLVTEDEEGLRLRSEFNAAQFEPATILRLMRQFQVLLENVVTSPGSRVSELPLQTNLERDQLVLEWNRTCSTYERESQIHEVFEAQAAATPNATAVVFQGQDFSYAELNCRANQLARRLQSCGVVPGLKVGLCLPRSFELISGMLAVLKAGGAYVPLDSDYPAERLDFILRDAGVTVVITNSELCSKLGGCGQFKRVIVLDEEQAGLTEENCANLTTDGSATCAAYVMYTSGSTGTPKGVLIPHRAVVRLVRHTNYMEFSSELVFLQAAPLTFDASTFEIWGALLNGARLVVLPPGIPSLEELGRTIRDNRVTTLWLTAGLFDQMVEHQLEALRGLKYLLAGGDVLSPVHVSKAARELSGCELINGYGPTENTTFSCCFRVPRAWPEDRPVPLGRPISNTCVYVLDQKLAPVPIGVPGELYVSGDGLALGYLNEQVLTKDRFLRNPFNTGEFAVLYRTGDRARWLGVGNLEFLGRIDQQAKIRGYRVEPGEVECALCQHSLVAASAVTTRHSRFIGKQLIAYVVPRPGKPAAAAELRKFLEGKLPSYMLPSRIVFLSVLPLTPNGKIDWRALPEPDPDQPQPGEGLIAPRTATEEVVAKIWCEILGRNGIGVHDNFFYLGGHSLLATQVISRISRATGVELPVRAIFEAPTVAGLATVAEGAQKQMPAVEQTITRAGPSRAQELLNRLDEFTEAEIEELLGDPELNTIL